MNPGIQIDGAYFIDRDGEMFRYVINYMRNLNKWLPPGDVETLSQLVNEAGYFCLEGMLEKLKEMVPTKDYTFEIYIRADSKGRVTSLDYNGPPKHIREYLDGETTNPESITVRPSKYGLIGQIINRVDDSYELYYHYIGEDGTMTFGFRKSTPRIALSNLQDRLGIL